MKESKTIGVALRASSDFSECPDGFSEGADSGWLLLQRTPSPLESCGQPPAL